MFEGVFLREGGGLPLPLEREFLGLVWSGESRTLVLAGAHPDRHETKVLEFVVGRLPLLDLEVIGALDQHTFVDVLLRTTLLPGLRGQNAFAALGVGFVQADGVDQVETAEGVVTVSVRTTGFDLADQLAVLVAVLHLELQAALFLNDLRLLHRLPPLTPLAVEQPFQVQFTLFVPETAV